MTTLLTRGAEGMDRRGFSIDEIEAMIAAGIFNSDEKFELLDGEIVPMSPQNMPHMMWKARLNRWLKPRLPDHIVMIPEGTLRISDRPATTFEPDFLIFAPSPGARAITPDMVRLAIEVSDTTRVRGLEVKGPRYGQAGVMGLWVVDIPARQTIIHRGPQADGWRSRDAVDFTAPLSPLFAPGLAVSLADIED